MDCIICGNWFSSAIHNGACPTCERAIKQLRLNMTPDRIKKLSKAEKDGRLMVLPCKRGDTLWSLYNYPTKGICEVVVTAVSTLDGVTAINTNNFSVLSEEDVGKTVFLTRKEAEAALKKRVEEDDETD